MDRLQALEAHSVYILREALQGKATKHRGRTSLGPRARANDAMDGVTAPYEASLAVEPVVDTGALSVEDAVRLMLG